MAYNVYFEDVTVGDELPAWSRKTDFMNWNRYAAVNDEFVAATVVLREGDRIVFIPPVAGG